MVAKSSNINSGSMFPTTKCTKNTLSTARPRKTVPLKKDDPCCFSLIRRKLREKGIPRKTRDIILQSWRASTKAQYDGFISRWIKFCKAGKTDPFQPNVNEVLTFLTKLFEQGLQYRSLGVARSALSTFLKICSNIDINSYAEVTRFMKGVFNSRPALPRLNVTWDVSIVLNYLESMSDMSLFQLSCKLSMLFLLLSAQRCQTLHLIELPDIRFLNNCVYIAPSHVLKQTRPGKHLETLCFKKYDKNKKLCLVRVLSEYIKRTKELRSTTKLLISTIKPFGAASKSTVSRWVKVVMGKAGIDITFKPHSTRSASSSKASMHGIPMSTIMKTAGWSNAKVFANFYEKPIQQVTSVQDAILSV